MSLQTDFDAFHRANPGIYRELVKLARKGIEAGATKLGIKQLFEVLRWDKMIRTNSDIFKLNNNMTAAYARKIMAENPDLAGIFNTRRTKVERERPTLWTD